MYEKILNFERKKIGVALRC